MKLFWNRYAGKCPFCAVLIFFVFYGAMPVAAQGEADNAIAPVRVSGDSLTLMDALYLALAHDPNIQLQKETTQGLKGSVMMARGQFDTSIFMDMAAGFLQKELTPSEWKLEFVKRELLRVTAEEADKLARGEDPSENIVVTIDGISWEDLDVKDEEQQEGLMDMFEGLSDKCGEIETLEEFYRCLSDRAQEKLIALGPIPEATENISASLGLGIRKPFRNGIVLTAPWINLEMQHRQFRGKPRDPGRGGTGEIESWSSTIGLVLKVPLCKGWGTGSTGAAERAARINHQAGVSQLRHTAVATALNVMEAYWDLVAAQEKHRLWKDSARLQGRIVALSRALVEGGEMPRADLDRIKARAAIVTASLTNARRIAKETRLQLAEVIGLDVEDMHHAPQASDIFPEPANLSVLRSTEPHRFIEEAVERRQDYRAALRLEDTARVLKKAARLDLKRRKDLELSMYYQGMDKDSSVLNGIGGALFEDLTGPSIMLTFTMDWPFSNNRAKGELLQARSRWRQSIITTHELERAIASNVVELRRTLLETAEQVHLGVRSVQYYEETVEAALERFRWRDITLVDTILTEERLTYALLMLVDARQAYAKALAGFRFETGTLLFYADEEYRIDRETLFTTPFLKVGTVYE